MARFGYKSISISGDTQKIQNILDETGFENYISGVDMVKKYCEIITAPFKKMVMEVLKNVEDAN